MAINDGSKVGYSCGGRDTYIYWPMGQYSLFNGKFFPLEAGHETVFKTGFSSVLAANPDITRIVFDTEGGQSAEDVTTGRIHLLEDGPYPQDAIDVRAQQLDWANEVNAVIDKAMYSQPSQSGSGGAADDQLHANMAAAIASKVQFASVECYWFGFQNYDSWKSKVDYRLAQAAIHYPGKPIRPMIAWELTGPNGKTLTQTEFQMVIDYLASKGYTGDEIDFWIYQAATVDTIPDNILDILQQS